MENIVSALAIGFVIFVIVYAIYIIVDTDMTGGM